MVNCDYISLKEAKRVSPDISVRFVMLDASKRDKVKESFKKFMSQEELDYFDMFDEIDDLCDDPESLYMYHVEIEEEIYLNIIESYLNNTYDINIKVNYLEACCDYLEVAFEVEEK